MAEASGWVCELPPGSMSASRQECCHETNFANSLHNVFPLEPKMEGKNHSLLLLHKFVRRNHLNKKTSWSQIVMTEFCSPYPQQLVLSLGPIATMSNVLQKLSQVAVSTIHGIAASSMVPLIAAHAHYRRNACAAAVSVTLAGPKAPRAFWWM
jgi:hypothetical protein